MPQILGWERTLHYSNLEDDEVQDEIETCGKAVIARWRHKETGISLEHVFEPGKKKPFMVKLNHEDINVDQEGRYKYRYQGDEANKAIQYENEELPNVSSSPSRGRMSQKP